MNCATSIVVKKSVQIFMDRTVYKDNVIKKLIYEIFYILI